MTEKSHLLTGHWNAMKLMDVDLGRPFRTSVPGTKVLSELRWTKQRQMEQGPNKGKWLVHAVDAQIGDFYDERETVYVEEVAL